MIARLIIGLVYSIIVISFLIKKHAPTLIGLIMTSKVRIYHLDTTRVMGWNNNYPTNHDFDVTSSLGSYTWRPEGSDLPLPDNSTLLTEVDVIDVKDPEIIIALDIMDFASQPRDSVTAIDVANQLMKMIARARMMSELARA
jgi:hypothetical protein